MLSVALMTLAERKVMGSMQRRVGPNKVGIWGILQPLGWYQSCNLNCQVGLIFAALIQGTLILWSRLIAVLSVQCQHVKINLNISWRSSCTADSSTVTLL